MKTLYTSGRNSQPARLRPEPGPAVPSRFQMNRGKRLICLALASLSALAALGQFSIGWYRVAGGGGTSSGGAYSVTGTAGQPGALGEPSGGGFSVAGGFWSLYALGTPGAPALTITLTPTNTAIVSWPSPSTGFGLQQNNGLSGTTWVSPSEPVNDNGVTRFIIVNPPTGNRFYRLDRSLSQ
jgi:hypothetical protein